MKMAAILNLFLLSLFVSRTVTYTQLVNSNTKAVSSTTYANYAASRTVDGNTDQNVTSCSHTGVRRDITEAWLRIDLGTVYSVKSVKFWYRGDRGSAYYNTERLRGYSLRVSNDTTVPPPESSCYNDPGNVTLPTIVEKDCERTARYIWIYQSNKPNYDPCPLLAICEVQVFGCETGHYWENCSSNCNHCKNNATCGIQNGECDNNGCASLVYQPPLCKECKTGYYGEDCSKKCDQCKNNASCTFQSEKCDALGCAYSGHQPPSCKSCIPGMYGLHCEKNCSRYCGFINCDRKTGACFDGCTNGYIGSFCNQTCPAGKYGLNCGEMCGHCYNNIVCNHGNETCLEGCEAGYWNHNCKTLCRDGRYGQNCQYTCSGNCVNGEACDKTNGSCRSCVDGFQGSKCDRACKDGEYGVNCHFNCSRHCLDGEVCNKTDGSCWSCADGYEGIKCNTICKAGKYGKACHENCGACVNSTVCNHITGLCELGCEPGWQKTETCKTACNNGTYGHNCQFKCRDNCLREVCDKTDGSCISCVDGHQTDLILLIISACYAIYMMY